MGQTKLQSLVESATNIGAGWVLSFVTWHFVGPLFGYDVTLTKNLAITSIFTVVSLARHYSLRRLFVRYQFRAGKADKE